ncbi:hypothetical protein LO749_17265 [Paracoccus denitrificans]|uniref:DUF6953 family protein n=1 Tax=Paracoccus denitrificans TaxID=266 RepID=UPI001E4A2C75|nr:hypothetical protein [Paracoccus denitrificans]UFS66274.1 hypothetical protein LO749_17265 [Paracoccus denitrificans]
MATAKEVADWIRTQLPEKSLLYQDRVARNIRQQFGEEFTYRNKNGNWGIRKDVLDEFRKLTPTDVVWSRSEQAWRRRRPNDPPGRMIR